MGSVYLAHDPSIDRQVAVKIVSFAGLVEPGSAPELERRFMLEARAAGRLNHPGIVSIYDYGIDSDLGLAYIAMEWVDGRSLAAVLGEHERLSMAAATEVVAQVASALDHAHEWGVIHRDIKPSNIILSRDGYAKILDFGVAKLDAGNETRHGEVLGTPAFMSPEQLRGLAFDGRSDLFALGAVLCQCLSGRPPFQGSTVGESVQRVLNDDPLQDDPEALEIPAVLSTIVARCLEKNPSTRYATGRALAQALQPFRPPRSESERTLATLAVGTAVPPRRAVDVPETAATRPVLFDVLEPRRGSWRSDRDETKVETRRPWLPATMIVGATVLAASLMILAVVPAGQAPESSKHRLEEVMAMPAEPAEPRTPVDLAIPHRAPRPARLVISYRNRLKSAWMSVWIDGERVWSEAVSTRGRPLARARGELVEVELAVAPGPRTIEIRVTGARKNIDASRVTRRSFSADDVRQLRVRLDRSANQLDMTWAD